MAASSPARILCSGIAVLDEVFRVPEVPPIDTKADATAYVSVSGGCAANAAFAIARLGGDASFAGPLGDDDTSERFLTLMNRENVDCSGCVRVPDAALSISAILVNDAGQRTIVTHSDQKLLAAAPQGADKLIGNIDCVLVDNRRPNFVSPVCAAARQKGLPIVLDADKPTSLDDLLLSAATHVIFSAESLKGTTHTADLRDALLAAHAAVNRFVAVTDGSNGALWCEGGELQTLPAFQITAVDTLAAGDVFHGAFALALAEGREMREAMQFGSAAAAVKCQRFGGSSTAPTRAEVEAFLRQQS